MAAIYAADIWCDDCADDIKDRICTELWEQRESAECPDGTAVNEFDSRDDLYDHLVFMDERHYDSDAFPKHANDDEESDCPQHCAALDECINAEVLSDGTKVGYFFGNSLTSYGDDYVRDAVNEDRQSGDTGSVACELWATCYEYIDYGPEDYCVVCGEYADLDENDECEDCAEDKPEDEDFTITPSGPLGGRSAVGRVNGKFVGEFDSDDQAIVAIKQIMEDEQFWPNIWLVSDHGNWSVYKEDADG